MLLFIQAPFQIMVTVHMALCVWNDGTLTKRAKLQDTFRVDLEKYVSLWYSLVSIHLSIMYCIMAPTTQYEKGGDKVGIWHLYKANAR